MSDDLISRQVAIDAVCKFYCENSNKNCDVSDKCRLRYVICQVPSEQLKTGRWEPLFGTIGKVFKCSECGAAVTVAYECFKDGCYYDYCPYCGAKMEGKRNA